MYNPSWQDEEPYRFDLTPLGKDVEKLLDEKGPVSSKKKKKQGKDEISKRQVGLLDTMLGSDELKYMGDGFEEIEEF